MVRILPKFVLIVASLAVYSTSNASQEKSLREEINQLKREVNALKHDKQPCHKQPIFATRTPSQTLYIKNEFPHFYNIVTQNNPKSNANYGCNCFGIFCFSALANLDLTMSDHEGSPQQDVFSNKGSVYGVGVRPLFGENDINFFGSINNLDLFIDFAVNKWVGAHIDIAYVNASTATRTYAHDQTDWTNVYQPAAALRLNVAYFLLANPACTPFYFQVGRFYSTFGDYDPFPITRSLPQLLAEQRTGGVILGAVFDNGLYASANWTMAQQSTDNYAGKDATAYFGTNKDRNYGGKLGFNGPIGHEVEINIDASYTADIRDSDYISGEYRFFNNDIDPIKIIELLTHNQYLRFTRAPGLALHAEIDYRNFALYGDYVTALNALNPDDINNSKIWAMDVDANYKFCAYNFPIKVEASYQRAGNADTGFVYLAPPEVQIPPPGLTLGLVKLGNILPQDRIVGSIWVTVLPNVTLAAQYCHDHDFGADNNGYGKDSNFATLRINVQV